jgi:uncharacterized RDD family membrane protein YckC
MKAETMVSEPIHYKLHKEQPEIGRRTLAALLEAECLQLVLFSFAELPWGQSPHPALELAAS